MQLESGSTRQVAVEGRTLVMPSYSSPISLAAIGDVTALRKATGGAAASMGREPGANGAGNATKRLRLVLDVPVGREVSVEALLASR